MKLLLTSAGLTNHQLIKQFRQMAGVDQPRVAFIATAARLDTDQDWVEQDRQAIKATGASLVELELDKLAYSQSIAICQQSDVIWFNGGNTYYARYWIEQSGLSRDLEELLASRLYVGSSAGSMIVGEHINLTDQYFPAERAAFLAEGSQGKLLTGEGLGLLPFSVLPHYASAQPYFSELSDQQSIKLALAGIDYQLYALSDGRAVAFEDGAVKVIGDGPWQKFGPSI
jgi:dipeptidase E